MTAEPKDIDRIMAEGDVVDAALNAAVRRAMREHVRAGLPAAEWRDGKVVWVPPEELERRLRETEPSE
jgi:hypothetical protein